MENVTPEKHASEMRKRIVESESQTPLLVYVVGTNVLAVPGCEFSPERLLQ